MSVSWEKNLNNLKEQHGKIAELLKGVSVSYIDIPSHYNTGDLLIYLGTECFFSKYNIDVQYRAIQSSINKSSIAKTDVIIVHGGGNFGDLYLKHHRVRERFLLEFAHKKIIFMPQSIHFKDEANIEETRVFFSKLKDVMLYVRDDESYAVGKKLTDNVELLPDMAHSLHPLIETCEIVDINSKKKKVLNLKRVDCESVELDRNITKRSFDWEDLCSSPDFIFNRLIQESKRLPFFREQILRLWTGQINYNVTSAINYVSNFDLVYTDRLHGFLISYLLGKEVVLLDNSYGKIARYYNRWFTDCELITTYNEKIRYD
ncbi:polysaccharide pyruvyl transferase family protein [Vibrio sp. DNB22_19_1]